MSEATIDATAEGEVAEQAEAASWDRQRVAKSIVNRNAALAAGAGLVPAPGVDVAAMFGVQLNMINRLCDLYDVPFSKEAGKNVTLSAFNTVLPLSGLQYVAGSLLKAIPLIGSTVGMATMPLLASSLTWALGQVLIRHYESGGNLLNLDAKQAKQFYQEKMAAAT